MDLGVPIDLNGGKIIFSNLIFLVLPFQKVKKGCVPKFGVLIFNLALVIKKWPHLAGSTVDEQKFTTCCSLKSLLLFEIMIVTTYYMHTHTHKKKSKGGTKP